MTPRRPRSSRLSRLRALLLGSGVAALILAPAATSLAKSPKVTNLEKLLKDSSEKVRIKAALGLGSIGDKEGVPALTAALKDPVAAVRAAAANALGQLGEASAKSALTAATKDADPAVRNEATKALARLKVPGPPKMLKKSYWVEIGDVLNRSKAKDGAKLVEHYKSFVSAKLRGYGGDFFWGAGSKPDGLSFGGAIKKVNKVVAGGLTQVDVALSLVVTTAPGRKIVTIADTEAGVGVEGSVSPAEEASLTLEALEAALDEAFKLALGAL